jgi:hypothetical protein
MKSALILFHFLRIPHYRITQDFTNSATTGVRITLQPPINEPDPISDPISEPDPISGNPHCEIR